MEHIRLTNGTECFTCTVAATDENGAAELMDNNGARYFRDDYNGGWKSDAAEESVTAIEAAETDEQAKERLLQGSSILLYTASGEIETSNLNEFDAAPADALALKFNDPIEDGRWVTDESDLRKLRSEDAPLSYTSAGLEAIGVEIEEPAMRRNTASR